MPSSAAAARPCVRGKFIYKTEKLYLRGVTYGTFRPDAEGHQLGSPDAVDRDFVRMRAAGINTVRTYTVPPSWFLEAADRHGLLVLVGLPWEQHVTFLDESSRCRSIETRVREGVRACAGHPAVLGYAIGNEIPASIVRWHGARPVERFIERLYRAAKAEDPAALVTYVNFPTTEYLRLPFLDFASFNVYLESEDRLSAYLARLHNVVGDVPLVLAEIGLDSRRNGLEAQAESLGWQVRTAFTGGCAGAIVFGWTDEWHRGGYEIEDWDFGLTTRNRRPKPALGSVQQVFSEVPFPASGSWPRISVVVCSCNGARTIRDCFEGLRQLEYPDFEVIVVNDGSTDRTASITEEFGFKLITTGRQGLSRARNAGIAAATGEIVAFLDDDARPDPHWLQYLADSFARTSHVGIGGPNIAPAGDGLIADAVANAPGGPVHVLLADSVAEHIPGCNMAFRKWALEAIGGFDPQFRAAGDDVDVCWRLQEQGWTLGFNPSAMVWHHRRNSVRAYWKQQIGYGRAEALLEAKWPEKYNRAGHVSWSGRLYGKGLTRSLNESGGKVFHGVWGTALFQSVYEPAAGLWWSLPLMPEWYLLILALTVLTLLGTVWPPLFGAGLLLVPALAAPLLQALTSAVRAKPDAGASTALQRTRQVGLVAMLHLLQPLARLVGRIRYGLTPWRLRTAGLAWPRQRTFSSWSERWQSPEQRLAQLESSLRTEGAVVRRGSPFARWDLEIRGGWFGGVRLVSAVEEHGGGKQLHRVRAWPKLSVSGLLITLFWLGLTTAAAVGGAWAVSAGFGLAVAACLVRTGVECGAASAALRRALGPEGTRQRRLVSALDSGGVPNA